MGYTFIDIGWWTQGWLPLPSRSSVSDAVRQIGYTYVEDGSVRTLVTDRRRVGIYVARIIADPRTLNHAVMVWDDEPSQAEAQELGVRLSGEGEAMKTKFVRVSSSSPPVSLGKMTVTVCRFHEKRSKTDLKRESGRSPPTRAQRAHE